MTRLARISTWVCGAENRVAFSTSSASRWMTSATAWPRRVPSIGGTSRTREYCSTSAMAELSTSVMSTGLLHCRRGDGAAHHGEVLGMAADAGGEVVDVEEALEEVGVLDLVLQLVQDGDLPVHQRLQAPGEVDEDPPASVRCPPGWRAGRPGRRR